MKLDELDSFERALKRGEVDLPAAQILSDYLAISPATLPAPRRQSLLATLSPLFPRPDGGNDVLARLIGQLARGVPFSFVLAMDPAPDLAAGLGPQAPREVQALTLELLATAEEEDVRRLAANHRAVFAALARLWLCTPDAGLADKAAAVLLHALDEGGADAWKRVLRDKDVYGLMLGICKAGCDDVVAMDRGAKSNAQSRLLEVLARMARMNWPAVSRSHLRDVEAKYGMREREGLVQFAVLRMVDWRADLPMHMALLRFFAAIIVGDEDDEEAESESTSPALEFLIDAGIHGEILKSYATEPDDDDALDHSLLYPMLAEYVTAFVKTYPDSESFAAAADPILAHVAKSLQSARWAQPASAVWQDLAVLAAFPPKRLRGSRSPLFLIPVASPSKAALDALGAIFHGPDPYDEDRPSAQEDAAALEPLFRAYADAHRGFADKLLAHARQPHDPPVALAALTCLRAILSAPSWPGARTLLSLPKAARPLVEFLASPAEKPERWSQQAREAAEMRLECAKALLAGLSGWEGARGAWVRALEARVAGPLWTEESEPDTFVATIGR